MFSFLKGGSIWLYFTIFFLYTTGLSVIAYNKGLDKGMDRVGVWQKEAIQAITEAMSTEHKKQMDFIEAREPIIQERITYLNRVKTEYETIVKDNPSPAACVMPTDLVRGYNAIR